MGFSTDWGNAFNKAILAFTGRNKVAVRELENVVKGTSPLVQSLVKLDANNPRDAKPADKPKVLKAFEKELKGPFAKECKKYEGTLDTALKRTDKDIHPEAYRQLKVLKTQLALVASQAESTYTTSSKETAKAMDKLGAQVDKEQAKLRGKGLDDDAINDQTYLLKAKKLLLIYIPAGKVAMSKAVAAIQAIKSDPTPKTYNAAMPTGGRDLSQQFANLIKIVESPNAKDWPLVKALPNLSGHKARLAAFGNGSKRTVPDTATKAQVLALCTEFSTMVKALMPVHEIGVAQVKKMK